MKFVLVVLALVADRFAARLDDWRQPRWFDAYWKLLHERLNGVALWDGTLGALVGVGLPALAAWLLVALLTAAWPLLGALAAIAVLLAALGPRNLHREVESYLAAVREGRHAEAELAARRITRRDTLPAAGQERHEAVIDGLLIEAHERLFGVVFWFVLLGPLGAALYRSAVLFEDLSRREYPDDSAIARAAVRLHGILAWLPVRLLALSYGLAGSFEDALADWRGYTEGCTVPFYATNSEVLRCAGHGALRLDPEDEENGGLAGVTAAIGLTDRALIVWLVVLALFSLAGMVI